MPFDVLHGQFHRKPISDLDDKENCFLLASLSDDHRYLQYAEDSRRGNCGLQYHIYFILKNRTPKTLLHNEGQRLATTSYGDEHKREQDGGVVDPNAGGKICEKFNHVQHVRFWNSMN